MKSLPRIRHCSALLFLLLALTTGARAQTCTASGPSLLLGTINPYTTSNTTTSGNGTYSCSNLLNFTTTIYACVSIGTGTGGLTATNRAVASGGATIPIQINSGGSSAQIGNGTSFPMYGPIAIPMTGVVAANSTGTFAIGVTLPPPATAPAPGTYTSSFSGADAVFFYYPESTAVTCSALAAGTHNTAQANFSISATIPTQCKVSATSMAFPTASVLKAAVTATATISVSCNASTPVTMALDNGATGTGPTARQMKSGSHVITYGIYRDAGFTLPWGSTSGTNTASLSTGTGTLTAYGQVPAQASPPPGSYTDAVNVTITY
nr:spore coat U domain-containing protein [uncultured Lichenicoccus sp.]